MTSRRRFLTGLGAAVGLVTAEPVRRYWQVGASLSGDYAPAGFCGSTLLVGPAQFGPLVRSYTPGELAAEFGAGHPIVEWMAKATRTADGGIRDVRFRDYFGATS